MKARIRKESPDLILLTGDNFMYASREVVRLLMETVNEECRLLSEQNPNRLSKFAVTYGNHDNQGDYDYYFINEVVLSLAAKDGEERKTGKYAAFLDYEDDGITGLANYYIDLVDDRSLSRESVDVIYRLHILDSNTYHFSGLRYQYDVIHEDQLAQVEKIRAEATVDKDYIGLCFFHIPLCEYTEAKAQYEAASDPTEVGQGEWRERILHPYENNGAFLRLRAAGIQGFIAGHNHRNYGDLLYTEDSGRKSLFSFGVKGSNQLYHDADMIGYKVITLEGEMTEEDFLSMGNVEKNFINVTAEGGYDEGKN